MKNLLKLKTIIKLSTIASVAIFLLFPFGVNSPAALAVTPGPTISVETINGQTGPFEFSCPTNPLFSPVELTGSGMGSAPPGLIEQYGVQINWGDGVIEEANSIFVPSSGQGAFTYTFSAGPHSYGDGTATITVLLYHQNPSGQDNQIDATYSVPICIVTEPPILTVIKEVINDDGGTLGASDFNLHVKIESQDVAGSPAPGSETGTDYTLAPGTFIVSEDPVEGYTQTVSGDCAPDGSVTLESGNVKTCTITNDDIAQECIPEGESGSVGSETPECCEPFTPIGCDEPDQSGNCTEPCVGAFYCTNCGDGVCGLGENKCNCPEDCEEEPEITTIKAYKVVCEAEEYLPNWATSGTQAGEPGTIGENTAQDYVTASQQKCWLEANWDFQWGFNGEAQKQAGDYIGPAPGGTGWNNFDSSTGLGTPAEVLIAELQETSRIWVRENLKENYIPFANPPGDAQDNVSAEILCHNDILNYDNYDYIIDPQLGEIYYCVAFNAPEEITECTPEDTQPCDTGQLGICASGTQTCDEGGFWGECVQDEEPVTEVCDDGLDNNCDGSTDCDDEGCFQDPVCLGPQCELGQTQSCDTGQSGICSAGTQTCSPEGFWGECIQDEDPADEMCDGLDNDCDGVVDNGSLWENKGESCIVGIGTCAAIGTYICNTQDPLAPTVCSAVAGEPTDEVCDNGLDDDCDGFTDCNDENCVEDPVCEEPQCEEGQIQSCDTGQSGVCLAGTQTCSPEGFWGECVQDIQPSSENCSNGLDDDCDGLIDGADPDCQTTTPPLGPPLSSPTGGGSQLLLIFGEKIESLTGSTATVSWKTNLPSTSRVVYDFIPHALPGSSPNYGYAFSTIEDSTKVTFHEVEIIGLIPGLTYYWRPISHTSPQETIGDELPFTLQKECNPGQTQSCSTGQSGICATGTQTCDQNGAWANCAQNVQASVENCTNGIDDDCDGLIDGADSDCAAPQTPEQPGTGIDCTDYYNDSDNDGYGVLGDSQCLVEPKDSYTATQEGDCDDLKPEVNPSIAEVCDNQVDDDCDAEMDCDDPDCIGDQKCIGGQEVSVGGFLAAIGDILNLEIFCWFLILALIASFVILYLTRKGIKKREENTWWILAAVTAAAVIFAAWKNCCLVLIIPIALIIVLLILDYLKKKKQEVIL